MYLCNIEKFLWSVLNNLLFFLIQTLKFFKFILAMPEEEHENSSEEEEEEDEPVPVRQQQVRMVVTDASSGYGQESTTDVLN